VRPQFKNRQLACFFVQKIKQSWTFLFVFRFVCAWVLLMIILKQLNQKIQIPVYMKKTILTKSAKASFALGKKIGAQLSGGEVLALNGDLGSGKTTFLQGLAKGLGVLAKVNSPTFNILKVYKIKKDLAVKQFCHIDAYRLNSASELVNLGFNDLLTQKDVVIAIEWASKVKRILPRQKINIDLKHKTNKIREIKINSFKNLLI